MNNTSAANRASRIDIESGRAVSVNVRAGAAIRVVSGTVWLTQEGDVRDHCVSPGMTFVADRAGRVVLTAIDGESAAVVHPAGAAWTRGVAGTVRIDSLETFEREARRAQARYLGNAIARVTSGLGSGIARLARRLAARRTKAEGAC
jgi:hypothetical protein